MEATTEVSVKKNGHSKLPAEGTLVRRAVTIVGKTPMLLNRISEETLLAIRNKAKKPKNAPVPTPREEADSKVYLTSDGKPYLPAQNLLASLIEAGKNVRLDGKRQMSTAKSTCLPAFLSLEEPIFHIVDPDTGKPATWEVDLRGGKNPNGGEAVCIVRPRFDRWAIKLIANIDTVEIGESVIRGLFDLSGVRVGIGDFRPQRKGIYGQFLVQCWERV